MPNRILREGWKDSPVITSLSWREQVFFLRLLSTVDDFGRFDGRAAMLRAACFPVELDKVSESDTESCLQSLEAAGVVRLYEVQGKRFVEMRNFRQQVRAKASKYPDPPSTCVADAQQTHSACVADAKHMHTKAEAEAEANIYKNKVRGSTTVDTEAAVQPPPALPIDGEAFSSWLRAMCRCVPQLAAFRCLPRDIVDAAREAFRCLPDAIEYAPLLEAYYASKLQVDCRRKEFWRPTGAQFFRELGDVVFKHALRWRLETGWRPAKAATPKAAACDPEPDEMSDEERAAMWEEMQKEVSDDA